MIGNILKSAASGVGRVLLGQTTKTPNYMKIGAMRMPSVGRIAKAIAPIAAIHAMPSTINLGTAFMEGSTTPLGLISRGLATQKAISGPSPFANTQITKSANKMSQMMRDISQQPVLSYKNSLINRQFTRNPSKNQLGNIALKGAKIG